MDPPNQLDESVAAAVDVVDVAGLAAAKSRSSQPAASDQVVQPAVSS